MPMRRSYIKPKPCATCGSIFHSKSHHNPRKALRKEAMKTKQKRLATRELWFGLNPASPDGFWYCYLQIAPDCYKRLTEATVQLEHNLSKARRIDLKYDVNNIFPACPPCNKLKGSLSAEEAMIKYKHNPKGL